MSDSKQNENIKKALINSPTVERSMDDLFSKIMDERKKRLELFKQNKDKIPKEEQKRIIEMERKMQRKELDQQLAFLNQQVDETYNHLANGVEKLLLSEIPLNNLLGTAEQMQTDAVVFQQASNKLKLQEKWNFQRWKLQICFTTILIVLCIIGIVSIVHF
ncbi:hypothetical protein SNEBB_001699 [Seison nebaliae]|nr:hypothetical protein SNEBB_001699 [Seison nebaliae]